MEDDTPGAVHPPREIAAGSKGPDNATTRTRGSKPVQPKLRTGYTEGLGVPLISGLWSHHVRLRLR